MMTKDSISRKSLLNSLGIGSSALMAQLTFYPNSFISPDKQANTVLGLSTKIINIDNYSDIDNIKKVRITTGSNASAVMAVSKACTHKGSTINYIGNSAFNCQNHIANLTLLP